jgi:hypothetical protein
MDCCRWFRVWLWLTCAVPCIWSEFDKLGSCAACYRPITNFKFMLLHTCLWHRLRRTTWSSTTGRPISLVGSSRVVAAVDQEPRTEPCGNRPAYVWHIVKVQASCVRTARGLCGSWLQRLGWVHTRVQLYTRTGRHVTEGEERDFDQAYFFDQVR